jgi:hypothetical protein
MQHIQFTPPHDASYSCRMGRNIIMLVIALLVGGAMIVTLLWFFRRLRIIEAQRRGQEE